MPASILERLRHSSVPAWAILLAGVIGALAPGLDLIYFYFFGYCGVSWRIRR